MPGLERFAEQSRPSTPGRRDDVGSSVARRVGELFLLLDHRGAGGHDYLVRALDGVVSYRNPACDLGEDAEDVSFAIDYLGSVATTLVLRRGRRAATLSASGYFAWPPLTLAERGPGVWSTPLGEVLDVSATPPRFANIRIGRVDPDRPPATD